MYIVKVHATFTTATRRNAVRSAIAAKFAPITGTLLPADRATNNSWNADPDDNTEFGFVLIGEWDNPPTLTQLRDVWADRSSLLAAANILTGNITMFQLTGACPPMQIRWYADTLGNLVNEDVPESDLSRMTTRWGGGWRIA